MPIELTPSRSSYTLEAVQERMARLFDDHSDKFAALVADVANDVQDDIVSRFPWPWLHGSGVLVTQEDIAEYSVEADCDYIDPPRMVLIGYRALRKADLSYIRMQQSRSVLIGAPLVNVPEAFALVNKTSIVLWPTPNAAYSLAYDYVRMVPTLSDPEDTSIIPPSEQRIWMLGIEKGLRRADDRADQISRQVREEYEAALIQAMFRYRKGTDLRGIPPKRPPSWVEP